ncbi:hypothetical protein [Brachybacterium timonense]|nr:hypothetical protein [Brachybacterium timonense]
MSEILTSLPLAIPFLSLAFIAGVAVERYRAKRTEDRDGHHAPK